MRKWTLTRWSASLFSGVLSGLLYGGMVGGTVLLPAGAALAASAIPSYTYEVVHAYPHDPNAFTQGLFIKDGFLYESTGLQGRSTVRKIRLETGEVLQKMDLPRQIFGEGITWWDKRLIGITWTTQAGYVLDFDTFAFQKEFAYKGEGWGLARNDKEIIMSDGTSELRFLDPLTLRETHRIKVTADGKAVDQLNELEWVKGEIFANIWQTDNIARIDPRTGKVVGWINLNGLLPMGDRIMNTPDVLNGIAYDAAKDRLFVTGKLWPKLFEIRLIKR